MPVFLFFFVFLSCFASDDNDWLWGTWRCVKSGVCYLAGAVNPCAQDSDFGSVCRSACYAKDRAASAVQNSVFWRGTDRLGKALNAFLAGSLVVGIVFFIDQPSSVFVVGTWAVTSLSATGVASIRNGMLPMARLRSLGGRAVSLAWGGLCMAGDCVEALAEVCMGG